MALLTEYRCKYCNSELYRYKTWFGLWRLKCFGCKKKMGFIESIYRKGFVDRTLTKSKDIT